MLKIKEIAHSKGIKMQEIADKMNISRQRLHSMITGNPTVDSLKRIADILGVDIKELFK